MKHENVIAGKVLIVLFTVMFFGCRGESTMSMNETDTPIGELKNRVLLHGDTDAYKELRIAELNYPNGDILFSALTMANKYDYPPAYFHVYFCLKQSFDTRDFSLENLDSRTKELALEFLKKAMQRKVPEAITEWDSVIRRSTPR